VEVVAHRGASAHAAEHTFAAYDLALALGADALEVDLRATADGKLVAVHDRTLERIGGGPRPVAAMKAAELAAATPQRARPLRLGAVLTRYGHRTRLLLELKDPAPPMERRLVAALARAGVRDQVVVQSFDPRSLCRVRRLDRALAVAPLRETAPASASAWLERMAALGASAVGLHHALVDAALVEAAHARGLAVRAWTVNDADEAARLASIGVDGLITDAPGRIRRTLWRSRSAAALAA